MLLLSNSLNDFKLCPIFPRRAKVTICMNGAYAVNKNRSSQLEFLL